MKQKPMNIGFDDAKFDLKGGSTTTQLIGVVCQGTRIVRVVRDEIQIDGNDSTEKLIKLIKLNEKHVQFVLTDTITFGGFNISDIQVVFEETGKPIIAVTVKEININAVRKALKINFPDEYEDKIKLIIQAGNLYETIINTAGGPTKVYYHCKGITPSKVNELLKRTCIDSKLPESVRIAHLIGKIF